MELLQLRYFFDSAKTENFSKTAEKYIVPPSTVSAAVKRLEGELGVRLFDRSGNRILLNENGKRVQQSLCIVFDELDKMRDSFTESPEAGREIRLLVRNFRTRVTDYLIEFKTKNPSVVLDVQFGRSEIDLDSYDAIISVPDATLAHYAKIELFTQRLCVQACADSPLRGRRLTFSQLANQPFLSMGHGSASHDILLDACHRAGFTPNIVMRCDDYRCYRKLVEEGIGLCISGESAVSDRSVKLDVTDFDERHTVYCYYKSSIEEKDFLKFLQFLKDKAV